MLLRLMGLVMHFHPGAAPPPGALELTRHWSHLKRDARQGIPASRPLDRSERAVAH